MSLFSSFSNPCFSTDNAYLPGPSPLKSEVAVFICLRGLARCFEFIGYLHGCTSYGTVLLVNDCPAN